MTYFKVEAASPFFEVTNKLEMVKEDSLSDSDLFW